METKFHAMPSVFVMEHDVPAEMVTDLNLYLDKYLKQKKRKSLASTLVGQIQHGQQLLMDHEDKKISEFTNMLCGLGAHYINEYSRATGARYKTNKQVQMDELWSVHSYERDYNPIHSHGTKTLMGISATMWTKVPQQILDQPTAGTSDYSLYNSSGHSDGCLAFQYGQGHVTDNELLKPSPSFVVRPEVGKLYLFPSWLQHMVYPFQGKGERRTVAANLNCWEVQQEAA
jgi:hypothetical protein